MGHAEKSGRSLRRVFRYFEWTFECRLRTKTNAGRRGACLRRAQIRNRTRAGKGDPPAGRVAVTAAWDRPAVPRFLDSLAHTQRRAFVFASSQGSTHVNRSDEELSEHRYFTFELTRSAAVRWAPHDPAVTSQRLYRTKLRLNQRLNLEFPLLNDHEIIIRHHRPRCCA